jgi:hypothetical protein
MRPRTRSTACCDAGAVKGLEQVIDGVHVEGAHGVLVVGRGKDNLRQGLGLFAGQFPLLSGCGPSAA